MVQPIFMIYSSYLIAMSIEDAQRIFGDIGLMAHADVVLCISAPHSRCQLCNTLDEAHKFFKQFVEKPNTLCGYPPK